MVLSKQSYLGNPRYLAQLYFEYVLLSLEILHHVDMLLWPARNQLEQAYLLDLLGLHGAPLLANFESLLAIASVVSFGYVHHTLFYARSGLYHHVRLLVNGRVDKLSILFRDARLARTVKRCIKLVWHAFSWFILATGTQSVNLSKRLISPLVLQILA